MMTRISNHLDNFLLRESRRKAIHYISKKLEQDGALQLPKMLYILR